MLCCVDNRHDVHRRSAQRYMLVHPMQLIGVLCEMGMQHLITDVLGIT